MSQATKQSAFGDCFVRSLFCCIFLAMTWVIVHNTPAAENAEESKRFYEKVVQAQPNNANAHFDLGNVYLTEKRYDDALAQYEKSLSAGSLASSRMGSYYFNLGVCYAGLGRMDAAIAALEKCVKVSPGDREAMDLLEIYRSKS